MRITPEVIEKVNSLCPQSWGDDAQGMWKEAYGIPNSEKRLCLVMRWSPGGVSGGSCWDSSNPQAYDNIEPDFVVLDKLLQVLQLTISNEKYHQIMNKIREKDDETDWEYYGNYTNWEVKYIPLEDVLTVIGLKALLQQL